MVLNIECSSQDTIHLYGYMRPSQHSPNQFRVHSGTQSENPRSRLVYWDKEVAPRGSPLLGLLLAFPESMS